MKPALIAVAGATGRQGGAVARHLLTLGFRVRGLSRNPSGPAALHLQALGAEVVAADLDDVASLRRGVRDADGVFSVQDYWEHGEAVEVRQGCNLANAAREMDVGHLVYSSVGSADRTPAWRIRHFDSKAAIERRVRELGGSYTILRPVTFFENLRAPALMRSIVGRGVLRFPFPADRVFQMVALEDLAALAANAFSAPDVFARRTIELASDGFTMRELAHALSEAVGRRVRFTELPMPVFRALTTAIELTRQSSRFDLGTSAYRQLLWNRQVDGGWEVDLGRLRAIHPGLTRMRDWVRSVRWSLEDG